MGSPFKKSMDQVHRGSPWTRGQQNVPTGRSAWFPLLTARRFSEFDTSVICHARLILCLGSFLLQDMF